MIEGRFILNESDKNRIVVIAVLFFVFLAAYFAYSANKFNVLSDRSVVKSNVVMKVIQHNVKSVCPVCGTKGVPGCPTCSVSMYWNGYSGTFVCPSCGNGGFPECPKCKSAMTWIDAV